MAKLLQIPEVTVPATRMFPIDIRRAMPTDGAYVTGVPGNDCVDFGSASMLDNLPASAGGLTVWALGLSHVRREQPIHRVEGWRRVCWRRWIWEDCIFS